MKREYVRPELTNYGRVNKLTKVLGLTSKDYINGSDNNDTGSRNLICDGPNYTNCHF
jgi:hypothetical protein